MAKRRCTSKFKRVMVARKDSRTTRCSELAAMQFNDFDVLCSEHAAKFMAKFPDQPARKVFAVAAKVGA